MPNTLPPQITHPTYSQSLQNLQNLKPITQTKPTHPKSSEVRGNSFRIDSKIFSLGFDGGRVDSYHLMERKGRFQGSIWLGIKGLRWALGEMGKLKTISATQTSVFQFLRDGYRTLEFSCLSNRGGRFVELSRYHGGSQKGSIRVPEGRHGAGWDRFGYELRNYFLTKLDSSSASPSAGEGQVGPAWRSAQGNRNRTWRNRNGRKLPMKSRDSRGGDKSTDLAPGMSSGESRQRINVGKVNGPRVTLSDLEPRQTRKFEFKWVLGQKSLRVTKPSDGPRVVAWVRPETKTHEPQIKTTILDQPIGPFEVGPIGKEVILQEASGEVSGEAE
jgi:hypothetical protein